jgi:hypothetical protein
MSILFKKYWEFGTEQFECTIKIQESKGFDCFNDKLPKSKGYNRGYDISMMEHDLQNVSAQINDDN